ncbi:MAG: alpha/beta hydrolase family protein [Bacillota bacterium]
MFRETEIYSDYQFLVSEGLNIYYYLAHPLVDGPFPLVLINHGGGGMDVFYKHFTRYLAHHGYVAAAMVFRGFPPSGGRQEYGDGEVRDLINLMAHLEREPIVDHDRIATLGNSRGGLNTLLLASCSKKIQAAVAWSTPVEMFHHYRLHPDLLEATIGGKPGEMEQEYQKRSVLYRAGSISCPVLLIHGDQDEVVPFWHAENMYLALKELDRKVELISLEGEGHNFTSNGFRDALIHTMAFLTRNLSNPEKI